MVLKMHKDLKIKYQDPKSLNKQKTWIYSSHKTNRINKQMGKYWLLLEADLKPLDTVFYLLWYKKKLFLGANLHSRKKCILALGQRFGGIVHFDMCQEPYKHFISSSSYPVLVILS